MSEWHNSVLTGDARKRMRDLPESSVHMCMTSPPYWQLRDYGVEGQLGLEPDSKEYVSNIADVCDEVKRVLRPDGSFWLNLGDTYDDKDLQQIPARAALELQARGWTLRNRVTWAKLNPMPNSVTDRLNTTTEAIFHLTPGKRYWYDLDAIREPHAEQSVERATCEDNRHEHSRRQSVANEETLNPEQFVHPAGKNPGDVFEVTNKPFPDAHFAVYPPELCEKPIKATCPPTVCAVCGAPYRRETVDRRLWERDPENVDRPQAKRALELAEEHQLTDEHMAAARAVNIGSTDGSDGKPYDRVDDETERLAREAEDALGAYYREFAFSGTVPVDSEWRQACDCDTDATEPGIVLDPFAGAGTTLLKAKELGRRFVGIELNPEYADMARARIGLAPHDPSHVRDRDDQTGFEAYADGGEP